MTYTIFARGILTAEQCRQADKAVKSGMIECAYDDVINFHDLNADDVQAARDFMTAAGFTVDAALYEEHYDGCICDLVEIDPNSLETVTGGADDIDIKWYMYTDADGLQTVVSNEMIADHGPESYAGYDMTEVQHIGTSYNAESDYFRLSCGRVALTDLCGLVQYIGDNRDDCADYIGDPDPDYWT